MRPGMRFGPDRGACCAERHCVVHISLSGMPGTATARLDVLARTKFAYT